MRDVVADLVALLWRESAFRRTGLVANVLHVLCFVGAIAVAICMLIGFAVIGCAPDDGGHEQ